MACPSACLLRTLSVIQNAAMTECAEKFGKDT